MWSPFKFEDFGKIDDLPNVTTDRCPDEAMVTADYKEDNGDEIFDTYKLTKECGEVEKSVFEELDDIDTEEIEEGEDCIDSEEEGEVDGENSPFEEVSNILEAILDDDEDDTIANSVEDMPDDDDPAINTNTEGIDEIEQDILDDEEDDLIDAAMQESSELF